MMISIDMIYHIHHRHLHVQIHHVHNFQNIYHRQMHIHFDSHKHIQIHQKNVIM